MPHRTRSLSSLFAVLATLAALVLLLPAAGFAASENITHKTVNGIVVDLDENSLTLRSDDGYFFIVIEAATEYPQELAEGATVAVDLHHGEEADQVWIADVIRVAS